jgi:hypothetical protein
MKWCLALTMLALTGGGCAATTAASVTAEAIGPDTGNNDGPPDQPGVVITAASPDDFQFRADPNGAVVPLQPLRPPIRRSVKPRVYAGMLIGAGVGALLGVMTGDTHDDAAAPAAPGECDPLCGSPGPRLGGLGYSAIGLGLGAAAGALFGLLENAFRW